jgi:hypothetical protein
VLSRGAGKLKPSGIPGATDATTPAAVETGSARNAIGMRLWDIWNTSWVKPE